MVAHVWTNHKAVKAHFGTRTLAQRGCWGAAPCTRELERAPFYTILEHKDVVTLSAKTHPSAA